jgi:pseudouridine kinase
VFDIIVIGGTNVDIKAKAAKPYIAGTSNPGSIAFTPGGVARNIAHNLGLLGTEVALISVIGNDAPGEIAVEATLAAGVDLSLAMRSDTPTGAYVALLDGEGELVSAVNDMRILENLTAAFVRRHEAVLASAKFVVVDCNVRPDLLEYLALQFGGKLVVEPVSVAKSEKLKVLLKRHEVLLATPNRDQIHALAENPDVEGACRELHARGLHNLVVHLGASGSFVSTGTGTKEIPAGILPHVSDVTGAGDAAVAGLVYGLSKGYDIPRAAQFGQAAASLKVKSSLSIAVGLTEEALRNIVKAGHE